MPAETRTDPRAWQADTIDAPESWYYPLSERALDAIALAALGHAIRSSQAPVTALRLTADVRAACADDIAPVLAALETGRGFAVITTGPAGRFKPRQSQDIYWLVSQALGRPFEQNVQGTLLYDVRDTGQDVRYGARFSVTNAESTFHTDNSFGDEVLDYVGLLCLNSARSGGLSQLASGCAVEQEMRAEHRDAWEVLRRPFHVDRRGGLRPGEQPTAFAPVLDDHAGGLLVRYLRYWIEAGHDKAGRPLTAEQVHALDTLDRVAGEPRMRVEFLLRPGEMLFCNNRCILHNRTAFEDFDEPERRRHYVRLWLQRH
jgi:alpha-ketoglutarate-dependent taurine dioxygenase